jgi:hypothetical protein
MKINWKQYDYLLGSESDEKLSSLIGCSKNTIKERRKKLNINTNKKYTDWSKYDSLLGTMSDINLSKIIGCSASGITHRRNKLNISAYLNKCKKENISYKINWDKYDMFLGKTTDKNLAKVITHQGTNCSNTTVSRRRKSLGISIFIKNKENEWDGYSCLLGIVDDNFLSQIMKQKISYVSQKRKNLNIKTTKYLKQLVMNKKLINNEVVNCKNCNLYKNKNDFYIKNNGYIYNICKDCFNKNKRDQRLMIKKECLKLLGDCCQNCFFNTYSSSLQFHHINNKNKLITDYFELIKSTTNRKKLFEELDKCCILCANCHAAYHKGELKIFFDKKSFGWGIKSV